MKYGIDFGTTHTVVAWVDRGNYPAVSFRGVEFIPTLVAANSTGELKFGHDAAAVRRDPEWQVLRSFKRSLGPGGPSAEIELSGRRYLIASLLTRFLAYVKRELLEASNVPAGEDEILEAAISVPANSGSGQRFLTLDAFAQSGVRVAALLNEPSAAGFEYAHRYRSSITSRREYIAIYDMGGGTFDGSLLRMTGRRSEVVTSEGMQCLGGDDLDEAILGLVLEKTKLGPLDPLRRSLLLEECARQKEAVHPNTRRLLVDLTPLEETPLAIPIDEVYEVCSPLIESSIDCLTRVFRDPFRDGRAEVEPEELAGIYVVGGSGAFPQVARLLRERFGERRVRRSPHPFAATAIGLAVFLDKEAGYTVLDRLSRIFGVFREAEGGSEVVFDAIFGRETPLPAPGEPPLRIIRRYQAAHNVGHYRFVECSRISGGRPDGDVTPWAEFRFPFDRRLRNSANLDQEPVFRLDQGPVIEESYSCSASGVVQVTLLDSSDGFSRTFILGRDQTGLISNQPLP